MSNSSQSIESSAERSATSGVIQPKEEVLSDDDTQEPSRKRVRMTENSGTSSGSTFGERMEDENHPWYKMLLKLKADNKIFHGTLLQMSNTSTDNKEKLMKVESENGKLKEKIATLEAEKKDLEEKMRENLQRISRTTNNEIRLIQERVSNVEFDAKQLEPKNVAFIEKTVQDCQKSVIHKLEKQHQEKLESVISNVKKEYEEKLKAADEAQRQIRKSAENEFREKLESSEDKIGQLQEAISNLKKEHEEKLETMTRQYEEKQESVEKLNAQFKKRLANMEKGFHNKMIASNQSIQKYEDCVAKMEARKEVIHRKQNIVLSEKRKLPATRAELEYRFKCIFCESKDHKSIDCRKYDECDNRRRKLESDNRCNKCLEVVNGDPKKHIGCPRSKVLCYPCPCEKRKDVVFSCFHHPIVCCYNDQKREVIIL